MKSQKIKDLKNYKILVLGASGSGKTVFLASMFKQLSFVANKAGFHLKADGEQTAKLNFLYLQIADSTAEWPEGNQLRDTAEYKFTCAVQATREHKVFGFTYLDYAGGWITDPIGTLPSGFANALENSDVLLGILDAQKILAAMNDETKRPRLRHEVACILQRIQSSEKPIHFVIMKWDLVDGKITLRDILSELNRIPEFDEFTRWRIRNALDPLIRVIPVSSVGNGFAEWRPNPDGEGGEMKKNGGVIPQPLRVEMPLACVFIDTFKEQHKIIQAKENEILTKQQKRKGYVTVGEAVAKFTGMGQLTASTFLTVFAKRKVVEAERRAYEKLFKFLMRGVKERREEEKEEALGPVKDEQTALGYALSKFVDLAEELERDFPESRLRPQ